MGRVEGTRRVKGIARGLRYDEDLLLSERFHGEGAARRMLQKISDSKLFGRTRNLWRFVLVYHQLAVR